MGLARRGSARRRGPRRWCPAREHYPPIGVIDVLVEQGVAVGRPVNRPRRIRRLAQLAGVGALCALATGATMVLLHVGQAGVDTSTLVTAPYAADPVEQEPLLIAPPQALASPTTQPKRPSATRSGGGRKPRSDSVAGKRPAGRTPVARGRQRSSGAVVSGGATVKGRPPATRPAQTEAPPSPPVSPEPASTAEPAVRPAGTPSARPSTGTPSARPSTGSPKPTVTRPPKPRPWPVEPSELLRPELFPTPHTADIEPALADPDALPELPQ